jgi:hypothetical protein
MKFFGLLIFLMAALALVAESSPMSALHFMSKYRKGHRHRKHHATAEWHNSLHSGLEKEKKY